MFPCILNLFFLEQQKVHLPFFYIKNLFKFGIVKNRAIHGDNSPVSFGHGNLMKKTEMFQLFCYIAPRSLSYLGKYFTVHMYLRIGNVLGIARVPCYFPTRGGGVLPYMGYIGMCRPIGYGF